MKALLLVIIFTACAALDARADDRIQRNSDTALRAHLVDRIAKLEKEIESLKMLIVRFLPASPVARVEASKAHVATSPQASALPPRAVPLSQLRLGLAQPPPVTLPTLPKAVVSPRAVPLARASNAIQLGTAQPPPLSAAISARRFEMKSSWRSLKLEMSKDEVKKTLGDPPKVSVSRVGEMWYYPDKTGGVVAFDKKDRVRAWDEP